MPALPSSFYDLLKALVRVPSVVGAEHAFFRELKRELDERGARVTWYDGLLVAQGDRPESLLLSAHVDRHGLICTGPNEFQYAAFVAGRRSDLLGNSVSEKLITRVADRFQAASVYAYEPWSGAYLGAGVIQRAYLCDRRKNLIFEIPDLGHLTPGTPVAFLDRLKVTDQCVSGQLDNVLCVAHLVHLLDSGFRGTLLFAAQEESGSSWRYLMEWFRRHENTTDKLVVVDTSPFPQPDGFEMPDVVLRGRDANAAFNPKMAGLLETLCVEQQVSYLFKDRYVEEVNRRRAEESAEPFTLGSTEMGRVAAASDGAIQGATLQAPTVNYHTMDESATLRANEAFAAVLQSLCRRFDA